MKPNFRIKGWTDLYEPKERELRGTGPLKYAKLRVHGHQLGAGWRALMQRAGDDGPACFGLF